MGLRALGLDEAIQGGNREKRGGPSPEATYRAQKEKGNSPWN